MANRVDSAVAQDQAHKLKHWVLKLLMLLGPGLVTSGAFFLDGTLLPGRSTAALLALAVCRQLPASSCTVAAHR